MSQRKGHVIVPHYLKVHRTFTSPLEMPVIHNTQESYEHHRENCLSLVTEEVLMSAGQ